MKSIAVALMTLFVGASAFAETFQFHVSLRSKYVDGIGRITIVGAEQGQITVYHDRNKCSPDGAVCTEIAPFVATVTPTLISDRRPVDGPLKLMLTDEITLRISSGFTIDEKIHYAAIVEKDGVEIEVPLYLEAYTSFN